MEFFMGTIMPAGFGFAPKGWALAGGQTLSINQNQALFALLGVQFGGDGSTTFALPNLNGRAAIGIGTGGSALPMGSMGGEEQHTLAISEMPTHAHPLSGSTQGNPTGNPANALPGSSDKAIYGAPASLMALGGAPMSNMGAGAAHNNMQPYTVLTFAVALTGYFPSRS